MRFARSWGIGCALVAAVSIAGAAAAPPAWLLEAAKRPTPRLPGDVPAYILLDETVLTVGADGTVSERHRYALRVLTQKGDDLATAHLPYTEKVDKLVSGSAWLTRGGKSVKSEVLSKWVDVCMITDGTVFTEHRNRLISFPRETLSGDVFGYETLATRPMLLPQFALPFSSGLPLAAERVEIVLPKGWSLTFVTRGSGLVEPVVDPARNSWLWQVSDQPFIPEEEWTPRVEPDAPRLFVSLVVPENLKGLKFPPMRTWGEVGAWVDDLGAGQCNRDDNLTGTAKRLAAPATDMTTLVRAISEHVQRLRYVAVGKGLGLGFGYKPRLATEVLTRGFGDCKDKANLLRAMLREVGVTAHLVAIESGRRHPTVDEWPSPAQFNHAISAIEVDATVDLPAVITIADGRRLLLFDPTDEYTVLGDLPWYLQGATGLLVQGADSLLVQAPELPHDVGWSYGTQARLTVAANGTATGEVTFSARRQAGRGARATMRNLTPREISDRSARYMSSLLRGVVIREPRFADDTVTGDTAYSFGLDAPGVFQPGPGGIYVMRLDVFNRDSVPQLSAKERVLPIEIRPIGHAEEVTFALPEGFAVDGLPKNVREESDYGVYERTVEVTGQDVVLRRHIQLRPQIVPAADSAGVRAFLAAAAKADKASLVLRRTP